MEKQIKKPQTTLETKTLVSNEGVTKEIPVIDSEQFVKDLEAIMLKYTGDNDRQTEPIMGTKTDNTKGFYLLLIKKDTELPEDERVLMTTLGQHVSRTDVIASFATIMADFTKEQKPIQNV